MDRHEQIHHFKVCSIVIKPRKHIKTQKNTKTMWNGGTLGVPWARFGRSRVALGCFSGALGRSWGTLVPLLVCSWNALGHYLAASWALLGKKRVGICFGDSNLEVKIHPSSSWFQNPQKNRWEKNILILKQFFPFCSCFPSIPTSKQPC